MFYKMGGFCEDFCPNKLSFSLPFLFTVLHQSFSIFESDFSAHSLHRMSETFTQA